MHEEAWECLVPSNKGKFIPSKMYLTPKKLLSGEFDKIQGRIVGEGHRQDRSLYQDNEISSPTVALASILAMAALAAHRGYHVTSLDHKAAILTRQKYEAVSTKTGVEHNFLATVRFQTYWRGHPINERIRRRHYNEVQLLRRGATRQHWILCSLLSKEQRELYHYLAKRNRFDILTVFSFCTTTRLLHPTDEDRRKLFRILGFLCHKLNQNLILRIGDEVQLRAYID